MSNRDNKLTRSQFMNLARMIRRGGTIIAADEIDKDYLPEHRLFDTIIITSDSGYEAIIIGDIRGNSTKGYMFLYYNDTPKRNSYPSIRLITDLLMKVYEKELLPTGEGKAEYFDYPKFGGIEKQLDYFSEVVQRMALVEWRDDY